MIRKVIIIFILLIVASTGYAQKLNNFGGYTHVLAETFYNSNFSYSAGLRYKEVKVGYFYQQATIEHEESKFIRKGLFAQVGLFNIDKCAYVAVGLRYYTSNDYFTGVVGHFETTFRVHKRVEIPFLLSTYKSYLTGSVGLRVLL